MDHWRDGILSQRASGVTRSTDVSMQMGRIVEDLLHTAWSHASRQTLLVQYTGRGSRSQESGQYLGPRTRLYWTEVIEWNRSFVAQIEDTRKRSRLEVVTLWQGYGW